MRELILKMSISIDGFVGEMRRQGTGPFPACPVGKKTVTAGKNLNDTQKRQSPSHA